MEEERGILVSCLYVCVCFGCISAIAEQIWLKFCTVVVVVVLSVVSWTQVVDLYVQSIVRNNFQSQNKIIIN